MDKPGATIASGPNIRIGMILLAAGGSARMGTPKQLLSWRGAPLILHTVNAALAAKVWPVVVVLGHAAEQIRPLLGKLPVLIAENPLWARGMGSSIHAGVRMLNRFSLGLDGAIVAVADQPQLSAEALNLLVSAFVRERTLVAARYSGALGSPALFPRAFFPQLLELPPEAGAQRILKAFADRVVEIDRPELAIDLDTPEDYQTALER